MIYDKIDDLLIYLNSISIDQKSFCAYSLSSCVKCTFFVELFV